MTETFYPRGLPNEDPFERDKNSKPAVSAPDDGDASASPSLKSVRSADLADYAGLLSELRKVQWRTAIGPKHHGILIERSADAIEQLAARVAELERVERAFRVQLAEANAALKESMARVAALDAVRARWTPHPSGEGRQ